MANCPYCGDRMTAPERGTQFHTIYRPTDRTRDHIQPKTWRGSDRPENIRYCCRECNELRALCGHCPAALMLAIDVARDRGITPRMIVTIWRLPRIDVLALSTARNGGLKDGYLESPSMLDENGRFVEGRYLDRKLGPLGPIEWADAQKRIAERRQTEIEKSAEMLEKKIAKAEARRLRKKAREMAEERERANAILPS